MKRKFTIVGAGNVGATIAYTLSNSDLASEIVMIDINKQKVNGEVLDIKQGTSFREPISVVAGEYKDAKDSDIVIITSGVARKPNQTRLELTQTNVNILKEITPQITKCAPDAIYVIVSNPVDIMTYVFNKISGIPEHRIIGSGTILDTARMRNALAEKLKVSQRNIHGYVFGEHGDTAFIPWSACVIASVNVEEYQEIAKKNDPSIPGYDPEEMIEFVRKSGGKIIADKGATFYGVANGVYHICALLVASADTVTTVSSMMHGEYGVDDVCVSVLTLIGPDGIKGKVPMKLTDEEVAKLQHSANKLKEIIDQIDLD